MSVDGHGTTVLNSHSAFFDHSADVVQVITKAPHRQTQHLNLCLRPLCPEDKDNGRQKPITETFRTRNPHFAPTDRPAF